jgi:hypothetical protein
MERGLENCELNTEVFYKVYIIESPGDMDLLEKRTEGKALSNILEMSEIPYEYYLTTTKNVLKQVFEIIKEDILELQEEYLFVWPIIHVSCHGNEDGIGLTDGSFIPWSYLNDFLSVVNVCFDEADPVSPIVLSMSSCYGLHAIKTDWQKRGERSPFAFVLGHEDTILWDEALIAFSVFFHHFVNKKSTSEIALQCMNASINSHDHFKLFNSIELYECFNNID